MKRIFATIGTMLLCALAALATDNFAVGHTFDGATGLKTGADLEDLVALATLNRNDSGANRLYDNVLIGLTDDGTPRLTLKTNSISASYLASDSVTSNQVADNAIYIQHYGTNGLPPWAFLGFTDTTVDTNGVTNATYQAISGYSIPKYYINTNAMGTSSVNSAAILDSTIKSNDVAVAGLGHYNIDKGPFTWRYKTNNQSIAADGFRGITQHVVFANNIISETSAGVGILITIDRGMYAVNTSVRLTGIAAGKWVYLAFNYNGTDVLLAAQYVPVSGPFQITLSGIYPMLGDKHCYWAIYHTDTTNVTIDCSSTAYTRFQMHKVSTW